MARGWGPAQMYTDEEMAERQARLRAELAAAGVDPTTLDPGLAPAQKVPTAEVSGGDAHLPTMAWRRGGDPLTAMTPEEALAALGGYHDAGWGIERPGVTDAEREQMRAAISTPWGDPGGRAPAGPPSDPVRDPLRAVGTPYAPPAALAPPAMGPALMPPPASGLLGGAVGLGAGALAGLWGGRGHGRGASGLASGYGGALTGGGWGAPQGGTPYGQAPTAALQTGSGYGAPLGVVGRGYGRQR